MYRKNWLMTIIVLTVITSIVVPVKSDSTSLVWSDSLGTKNYEELATDVITDSLNNAIVVGYSIGDFLIVKYDPFGEVLWSKSPNIKNVDRAHGVAVDSEGNVIVTGCSFLSHSNDYLTMKYDSDGNELWGGG